MAWTWAKCEDIRWSRKVSEIYFSNVTPTNRLVVRLNSKYYISEFIYWNNYVFFISSIYWLQSFLQITAANVICHACWTLVTRALETNNLSAPITGHQNVCVLCGQSLLRTRSHRLTNNTEREQRIRNVVAERILPRQVSKYMYNLI